MTENNEKTISFEWSEETLREDAEVQLNQLYRQGRIHTSWSREELIDFICWLGMQKDICPIRNTMQTPREYFLRLLRSLPGTIG